MNTRSKIVMIAVALAALYAVYRIGSAIYETFIR